MVGHQNVGVHLATVLAAGLIHGLDVDPLVLLGKETGLTVIAALNDVLRIARELEPRFPWHDLSSLTLPLLPILGNIVL
jgi:hypothetical protein